MFDFAISRNQQRRPTKRMFASWAVSCIVHLLLVIVLVEFPQLLRGGMYHRFRPLSALTNLFGSQSDTDDDKNWRTVTVLRPPMMQPSAATLKKYLKDWTEKPSTVPPIQLRWGNEQRKALENTPPMPKVHQEPKAPVVLPAPNDAPPVGSQAGNANQPAQGSTSVVQVDPNAAKRGIPIPPPASTPKTETASNNPPAIPDAVKPPATMTPPTKDSVKVFDNEQQAIRSSDSGFFDAPKGFPLGEYANLIKERIKGKWYIPSHLKNSQGHTTIVFYISKDGRYSNVRIEPSSSSGNTSLDLAALKAIMDSSPFPPLPKGFPGDHLGAKFVLSYNEP